MIASLLMIGLNRIVRLINSPVTYCQITNLSYFFIWVSSGTITRPRLLVLVSRNHNWLALPDRDLTFAYKIEVFFFVLILICLNGKLFFNETFDWVKRGPIHRCELFDSDICLGFNLGIIYSERIHIFKLVYKFLLLQLSERINWHVHITFGGQCLSHHMGL